MNRSPNRPNFAARAARWSADRWKTAASAWLAVVIVAGVLGAIAGTVKLTDSEQATGETARVAQILTNAGFKSPASESVLVQSRTLTAGAPRFRAAVADVTGALRAEPQAIDVRSPYAPGADGQVSKDGPPRSCCSICAATGPPPTSGCSRTDDIAEHYWSLHSQPNGAWEREIVHTG